MKKDQYNDMYCEKIDRKSFLGQALQKCRLERGLSLAELGKILGVKAATISSWEKGKRSPLPRFFPELMKTFKKPLDYFFEPYVVPTEIRDLAE